MPKKRRRKKMAKQLPVSANGVGRARVERTATARAVSYADISARAGSMQHVVFSAMVALGFWGFTIFCLFFYTVDPNHYLYGAILALTALGWSWLLLRRWSRYRRQAGGSG
jgi:hypothetical protein